MVFTNIMLVLIFFVLLLILLVLSRLNENFCEFAKWYSKNKKE
jgi:uncharacterized protein HemY